MIFHMDLEANESEADVRKRLRRKRSQLIAVELMQDFAQNTSLHGLRYIAERGLSRVEKLFWTSAFVISLSLCAMLIWNVWVKWQTSPIMVTLSDQLVSVEEVPFPSITICPQLKLKQTNYDTSLKAMISVQREYYLNQVKYQGGDSLSTTATNSTMSERDGDASTSSSTLMRLEKIGAESTQALDPGASQVKQQENEQVGHLMPSNTSKHFEASRLICGDRPDDLIFGQTYAEVDIVRHIIYEASVTLDDVFYICELRKKKVSCKDMFKPVLTTEGVCFTMNSLAAHEIFRVENIQKEYFYLNSSTASKGWSLAGGYSSTDKDVYPIRGRGSRYNLPDVDITLKQNSDAESCILNADGFKVYLHHPADLPQSSLYYHSALSTQVTSFGLKFSVLNTSSSLKSYTPKTRNCYFPGERQLRYFLAYTADNCRLECLSNYTLDFCGCVWFHMPHNNVSAICGVRNTVCVINALESYTAQESHDDIKYGTCQCLPLCLDIQYDADILKTSKYDQFLKYRNKNKQRINYTLSRIELYYKVPRIVSMWRSELFGLTDFLANCGGLLGLFLGFSFLSLVEIAYFLTLRLNYTLWRNMQQPDNTAVKHETRY